MAAIGIAEGARCQRFLAVVGGVGNGPFVPAVLQGTLQFKFGYGGRLVAKITLGVWSLSCNGDRAAAGQMRAPQVKGSFMGVGVGVAGAGTAGPCRWAE